MKYVKGIVSYSITILYSTLQIPLNPPGEIHPPVPLPLPKEGGRKKEGLPPLLDAPTLDYLKS